MRFGSANLENSLGQIIPTYAKFLISCLGRVDKVDSQIG